MDKQIFILANMSARSPGPAQYILKPTIGIVSPDPTLKSNPVHSFNCRRSEKTKTFGPGPIYDVRSLNNRGKDRPVGGFMGKRFEIPAVKIVSPGPANYCVKSPQTSASRVRYVKPPPPRVRIQKTPGPDAYCLPQTLYKRDFKFGGPLKSLKPFQTPGPGTYDLPHADVYLSGRYGAGCSFGPYIKARKVTEMPGPATYCVPSVVNCCPIKRSKTLPHCTFGKRRPAYSLPFAVPEDDAFSCC